MRYIAAPDVAFAFVDARGHMLALFDGGMLTRADIPAILDAQLRRLGVSPTLSYYVEAGDPPDVMSEPIDRPCGEGEDF